MQMINTNTEDLWVIRYRLVPLLSSWPPNLFNQSLIAQLDVVFSKPQLLFTSVSKKTKSGYSCIYIHVDFVSIVFINMQSQGHP